MRILITNDDSISSPCLHPLAKWAQKLGEVTVMAPKFEQSGKSHAINLRTPFEVKQTDALPGVCAWTVDSTPADCVRMAVLGMNMKPDLVISGINRGYNMGFDILYSGTAGAVFEASLLGIPALALSTDFDTFDPALSALDDVWDFFCRHRLFDLHDLYNVNIPTHVKGIRVTRQGGAFYSDTFEPQENDLYQARGCCVHQNRHDLTLDVDAVADGYISVSPLTACRTSLPVYEQIRHLQNDRR